ncbi:MAG: hypothetical protein U9R34_05730, partial [Nanoarchaeota archaeon]|nr:hypothetical protein [Nanoarchaeota archaeon]
LKVLLKNAEDELGINIMYIVFNENKEIDRIHLSQIKKFLSKLKYNSALVILEGIGGYSNSGKSLALELRLKFKKYFFVAIPNFAKSAMVFPIFPATTIFMDSESIISPVEPFIKNKKSPYIIPQSTLDLMKHQNKSVRKRAKKHWKDQAEDVLGLLELPGSIVHKYEGIGIEQLEKIIKLFLCSPHEKKITKKEIQEVGFYCFNVEGKEYWKNIQKFTILLKKEIIMKKQVSFVMGDINSYEEC